MKIFRFFLQDGSIVEQEGVDFRDAVQNQGFSLEDATTIVGYEEVAALVDIKSVWVYNTHIQ